MCCATNWLLLVDTLDRKSSAHSARVSKSRVCPLGCQIKIHLASEECSRHYKMLSLLSKVAQISAPDKAEVVKWRPPKLKANQSVAMTPESGHTNNSLLLTLWLLRAVGCTYLALEGRQRYTSSTGRQVDHGEINIARIERLRRLKHQAPNSVVSLVLLLLLL